MRKKFFWVIVFLLASLPAYGKRYAVEPLLVPESPYNGITFYVYRPYNMPPDWYITLDGYPVRKNRDGMWVYGTAEGPNLVATNYVVGSVVPSMAGINKWLSDVQISELQKLPAQDLTAVSQRTFTRSQMAGDQRYSTYIPEWSYRYDFMAIGNWKGTVDRIGVLDDPATPVAWKGVRPQVIYVWVGKWHQILLNGSVPPLKALRREKIKLRKLFNKSGFKFYAQDVPILTQQSKAWGYYWLGELHLNTGEY